MMFKQIQPPKFEEIQARRDTEVAHVESAIEFFETCSDATCVFEPRDVSIAKAKKRLADLNDETIWIPRFTRSIVLERVDEYLRAKAEELPALKAAEDAIRAEWERVCIEGTVDTLGDADRGLAEDIVGKNQPRGILDCVTSLDHAQNFLQNVVVRENAE